MKRVRHITIPVFVPGVACPFHCIFCDQKKISGRQEIPSPEEVAGIIEKHLSTIDKQHGIIELGFFGGTFTGLSPGMQRAYLEAAQPYLKHGLIREIRLSTRPDFINEQVLELLKRYPVRTIELGAQSMDDGVLSLSCRGHTPNDTIISSQAIIRSGFKLGLQMMIGLPGDTLEKSINTAIRMAALGAADVRIYPVLVIRGTTLEHLYASGKYTPLTIEEAIHWTMPVVKIFEEAGVNIIRIGLHPSEGLLSQKDLVAGPFHPSFRELVMTESWNERFSGLLEDAPGEKLIIRVNPLDYNNAIGYHGKNRKILGKHYKKVLFRADPAIKEKSFHADHY